MLFGTIKQAGGADKHTNIYDFYVEHTTISRVGGRADINDIKPGGNCKIMLFHSIWGSFTFRLIAPFCFAENAF